MSQCTKSEDDEIAKFIKTSNVQAQQLMKAEKPNGLFYMHHRVNPAKNDILLMYGTQSFYFVS